MLLQPSFFAPLIQYVALANSEKIVLEKQDNFQKQTYRNRCYIYGANGKQLLTVPILHAKSEIRQKTKDIRIDNSFGWQKNVIKSLEAGYRSSPFFEYYEDDVCPVIEKKYEFLLDLNLATMQIINESLRLDISYEFTDVYQLESSTNPKVLSGLSDSGLDDAVSVNGAKEQAKTNVYEQMDFRYLVNAKSPRQYDFKPYTQVFGSKHGYLSNLSILDLLFNEGTNAINYLQEHRSLLL